MKTLALLLVLVATAAGHAQTLVIRWSEKSGINRLTLPTQFVVDPDAIRYLVDGRKDPTVIPWEKIDVAALAASEPEIETARKKAVLSKRSTYFTVVPPVNYYRVFLGYPVKIKFNPRYQVDAVTVSRYAVSFDGFVQQVSPTSAAVSGRAFVTGESISRINILDTTRFPLATDMAGVLYYISDTRSIESQRLILALQDNGYFFPNLLIGLENLSRVYPKDGAIRAAIETFRRIGYERTVHIDSQQKVGDFLRHLKIQSR